MKAEAERGLEQTGLPWVVVRPTGFFSDLWGVGSCSKAASKILSCAGGHMDVAIRDEPGKQVSTPAQASRWTTWASAPPSGWSRSSTSGRLNTTCPCARQAARQAPPAGVGALA
jgi:hypothetical protein